MISAFRHLFHALVICSAALFLTASGCSGSAPMKEVSPAAASLSDPLIGRWVYQDSDSFIYEFKSDGTGTYTKMGEVLSFRFYIGDNTITFRFEGEEDTPVIREYALIDDRLNIKDSLGGDSIFQKEE